MFIIIDQNILCVKILYKKRMLSDVGLYGSWSNVRKQHIHGKQVKYRTRQTDGHRLK